MVLPHVHIATAAVALNAAASFSAPIICCGESGSTSSPGQSYSLNRYLSTSGPEPHGPPLSSVSSSSGSLYPQSSSHSPHSQSSQSSFGPAAHLWEDMRTQSSNSAHDDGSVRSSIWSPRPQGPPHDNKKLSTSDKIKMASVGLGVTAIMGGLAYTAASNTRRDVDELEDSDSLDARELMFDLDSDKLD